MTDLMEALFEYINKVTLQNYLAVDSDYRISSTRRDTWSLEILDHLDEPCSTAMKRPPFRRTPACWRPCSWPPWTCAGS